MESRPGPQAHTSLDKTSSRPRACIGPTIPATLATATRRPSQLRGIEAGSKRLPLAAFDTSSTTERRTMNWLFYRFGTQVGEANLASEAMTPNVSIGQSTGCARRRPLMSSYKGFPVCQAKVPAHRPADRATPLPHRSGAALVASVRPQHHPAVRSSARRRCQRRPLKLTLPISPPARRSSPTGFIQRHALRCLRSALARRRINAVR